MYKVLCDNWIKLSDFKESTSVIAVRTIESDVQSYATLSCSFATIQRTTAP
jgi:hypothetical protein